jgi:hypothetical protein
VPLSISRANLLSRSYRSAITGGALSRVLNVAPNLSSNQEDGSGEGGNAIQRFFTATFPWAKRFIGFLSAVFQTIGFSFSAVFSVVVNAVQSLTQFDWNASDKELQAGIDARNIQLAAQWGGVFGSGVGWIAGIAIGYGFTVLCPVIGSANLAKLVAGEATLEALQEVGATTANAVRSTINVMTTNTLVSGYRKLRRALGINPPDDAPTFTIAGKLEEKIESIKNPVVRAFLEEFTDEFFDSFIEAGFIFAYELDSQLAASRAANAGGQKRGVLLLPDKETPDEKIVLIGGQDTIANTIQTTLAQHRLINNRDLGQLVGQPVDDWMRATPKQRSMIVAFADKDRPPYLKANNVRTKFAYYTIPDPKPGLSWQQIKAAAKAYNWGKYRCTANLSNQRQMAVYGSTADEAEEKLRELLALSNAEIVTLSISQERDRPSRIKKDTRRMWPQHATLLVRKPTVDSNKGRFVNGEIVSEKVVRFELWTETEPRSFKDVVW